MNKPLSRSEHRQIEELAAKFEPLMRAAFMAAIADLISGVDLAAIIRLLEKGDIEGAISALNINRASFRPVDLTIWSTFEAGGVAAMAALPVIRDRAGTRLKFRFDVRNLIAEKRITLHSSKMITRVTDEVKEIARQVLVAGLAKGENPRRTAVKLVGAYDRAAGKRVGGVLGLSKPQSLYVDRARAELLDGSPASLKRYLTRTLRDKRFDRTVMKAIQSGDKLPASTVEKLVVRYSDKLLKARAETIGQTETMDALNASRIAAYGQIADETGVATETAVKVWKATSDNRTRDQHAAMNNSEVVGLDTPFTLPDGSQMLHPCDTSLGAPASQTINCRCTVFIRLNYLKGLQ